MSTTKGTWHRPEAEPGAFAKGYDAIKWDQRESLTAYPSPSCMDTKEQEAESPLLA